MSTPEQTVPAPSRADGRHSSATIAPSTPPPQTAEELTAQNVRTIIALESAARSSTSIGERVAARVAAFCGSMKFVWMHLIWFGGWIFYNSSSAFLPHPDPFPFTFLTLSVSLEAIFLSAFILISQNQETRLTDQRSHLDLQISLLVEQENTKMLKMLKSIANQVGADIDADSDLAPLEEATRPDRLLNQIELATAKLDAAD